MNFNAILHPEQIIGPLPALMADLGFDEIRAVLDPLGQKVFDLIRDANNHAVMRSPSSIVFPRIKGSREFRDFPNKVFRYVRCHNMFTGDGGDRQGAKNAGLVDVTYDDKGLHCNFDRLDAVSQTFLDAGCIPFVELGFTPPALAMNSRAAHAFKQPDARDALVNFDPREDFDDDPKAIQSCPPRSFTVWGELVRETIKHLQERFGAEKIRDWLFELWNEPDGLGFWTGTVEEYAELYEKTAKTIKAIDPELRIGGPAIARRIDFLKRFLAYVTQYKVPLDFISVHAKGGHPATHKHPSSDEIIKRLKEYVKTIGDFPEFTDMASPTRVPILINEADEFLDCVSGIVENPIYAFRETTYYPCFVANLYKKLLDYLRDDAPPWVSIYGAYSDNLHMIDERWPFGGYRCTTTTVPVDRKLVGANAKVVAPFLLSSGKFDVPTHSAKWNVYAHIEDRARLFSSHPMHPAWNEPFIVVKKPVFHVYGMLQNLGPDEVKVEWMEDVPPEKASWFNMIASLSRDTKEVVAMAWYFSEDLQETCEPVTAEISVPERFSLNGKQVTFKSASTCQLTPDSSRAFDEWRKNLEEKDTLDEAGIDALLRYNKIERLALDFVPDGDPTANIVRRGDHVTFQVKMVQNSLHEWFFQYE
ncbi:MAG: hypothetical protein Q6370_025885 [Candidatus Sigynarchaeota archaeon]